MNKPGSVGLIPLELSSCRIKKKVDKVFSLSWVKMSKKRVPPAKFSWLMLLLNSWLCSLHISTHPCKKKKKRQENEPCGTFCWWQMNYDYFFQKAEETSKLLRTSKLRTSGTFNLWHAIFQDIIYCGHNENSDRSISSWSLPFMTKWPTLSVDGLLTLFR